MGLFMARLVLSGVLERHPGLRILTHHGGGMIPTFAQRVGANPVGFQGPEHQPELESFQRLAKPPLEYLKMFYADTTVGAVARTIRISLDFFGPSHVLFASDWPYGPPSPSLEANLTPTLRVLGELGLPESDLAQVLAGNARRVLGLGQTAGV
jgi:aminocarboxymuconate-semialdehyde decarboxylase